MDFLLNADIHSGFWTMITAIAALLASGVAWLQLSGLNKTSRADFLFRFNRDFFDNQRIQEMIKLIEFERPLLKQNKGRFDDFDIDNLLGYFELMDNYIDKGIMNLDDIDETFGYYIQKAWGNKEVKVYIDELRKETNDPNYYTGVEDLILRLSGKKSKK